MNPAWFLVGLHIGDRIAPVARPVLKRLVRETYWKLESGATLFGQHYGHHIDRTLSHIAYRRWVRSLP